MTDADGPFILPCFLNREESEQICDIIQSLLDVLPDAWRPIQESDGDQSLVREVRARAMNFQTEMRKYQDLAGEERLKNLVGKTYHRRRKNK